MRKFVTLLLCYFVTLSALAQIGEHRNDFAIGINGGYQLSNVGFVPRVSQGLLGGFSGGLSMRYVCEKYFNTICSVQGEVNFAQAGWKESILDEADQPVINATTELPEEYSRTINYVQVPIFAHLAWGREQRGAQFFFQVGPQFGYYLSESTKSNFNWEDRNMYDRVNPTCAQDTMAVEHKFDYGIAVGGGLESTTASPSVAVWNTPCRMSATSSSKAATTMDLATSMATRSATTSPSRTSAASS